MKNRGFIFALPIALIAVFVTGCYYHMESEERDAAGFSSIALDGTADIYIRPGKDYRVTVTARRDVLDKVSTKVSGSILRIDNRKRSNRYHSNHIDIDIYMPELKNITHNGAGDIQVYSGNGSQLDILLSGVGDISAQDYKANNVNVTLTGVGDVKVWAADTLNAKLTGVGDIRYKGNPKINTVNNGMGRIRKL
ncbi:MAG: DUF2807 domain-containing protein [Chitinispirillales bacterium]|nr:DUF2807 domain-containing protein [Chitinispirillales bacterium]